MTTIKPGQTVQGMHLTGRVVTGTVLRVRPSIIDNSIQVVDVDVDGREMHLALEDCTLVRAPAPTPQEDPMPSTQTAAPKIDLKVKKTRTKAAPAQETREELDARVAAARAGFPFKPGDVVTNGSRSLRVMYLETNHFGLRKLDDTVKSANRTGKGIEWIPYLNTEEWTLATGDTAAQQAAPQEAEAQTQEAADATLFRPGTRVEITYINGPDRFGEVVADDDAPADHCRVRNASGEWLVRFSNLRLVDDQAPASDPASARPEAERTTIPWNRILNSPLNPRKAFDEAGLRELAANIHAKGLKQNLVVRPHPDQEGHFEIAAGERRWRAIGLLVQGFEAGEGEHRDWLTVPADWPVPVLVEHLTDLELLEVATAENVQRRRMTPLEEADAFAALVDHGGDVDEIAAKFGFHKRTVIRRVQISKGLAPLLREKFNAGELTLAQVEVLATVGPEVQEAVWNGYLSANPRLYSADHIRKHLPGQLFLVKDAQFPRTWYTGAISEPDLFGDVEQHFLDAKQAFDLQVKHARLLAEKAVEEGAAFAEVELGSFASYKFGSSGTGVVYCVHPKMGTLSRHDGLGARVSWGGKAEYAVQGETKHETPARETGATPAAPTPAAPPSARAICPGLIDAHGAWFQEILTDAAGSNEHLIDALFVISSLEYESPVMPLPGVDQAMTLVHELEIDADDVTPLDILNHLLSLPKDAVHVLALAFKSALIDQVLGGAIETSALLQHLKPFQLSEDYLKACNTLFLEQLWEDAGLGSPAGKSDSVLRHALLKEAPALAARGFLPRPLRTEERA